MLSYLMYLRNYRPRKTCLDKCLKAPVWVDLSTGDMVDVAKHWFNLNQSVFINLSDSVKLIEFQRSLLDSWKLLRTFLNTVTACDKYCIVSRDNWMQTSQMYLSQKQVILSQRFSTFFESALNFELFQKKVTLIAYVFPKLPTTKDLLR